MTITDDRIEQLVDQWAAAKAIGADPNRESLTDTREALHARLAEVAKRAKRLHRILVTGSREPGAVPRHLIARGLRNAARLFPEADYVILVHGGARGVATAAHELWTAWSRHDARYIPPERHPADWDRWGVSAGHRRKAEMVKAGAAVCIAFPHGASPGTRGCMRLAAAAGIPVIDYSLPTAGEAIEQLRRDMQTNQQRRATP